MKVVFWFQSHPYHRLKLKQKLDTFHQSSLQETWYLVHFIRFTMPRIVCWVSPAFGDFSQFEGFTPIIFSESKHLPPTKIWERTSSFDSPEIMLHQSLFWLNIPLFLQGFIIRFRCIIFVWNFWPPVLDSDSTTKNGGPRPPKQANRCR